MKHSTNLVVLRAIMATDPTSRELADGTVVVQFDVTTPAHIEAKTPKLSVPVAWINPSPAALAPLSQGEDVVVIGSVRRRFFRSGAMTQSRTEVVADRVVPTRRVKTVRSLLAEAAQSLGV
jgi:single-strand DNA-binding protein